jgi:hypothetical protein
LKRYTRQQSQLSRGAVHESGASNRDVSSGQSLVEFALVLPILAFMLLGILDLSRVFTSIMTVESAAREAADYGAWQSVNWQGDPTDPDANRYKTVAGMEARACTAARNLVDFVGSPTACTNPSISIDLLDEHDLSAIDDDGSLRTNCDEASRAEGTSDPGPCRVKVDLTYTFDLMVPLGIDFFDTHLGLPQQVTFTRSSIFAISDFSLDS